MLAGRMGAAPRPTWHLPRVAERKAGASRDPHQPFLPSKADRSESCQGLQEFSFDLCDGFGQFVRDEVGHVFKLGGQLDGVTKRGVRVELIEPGQQGRSEETVTAFSMA